MRKEKQECEMRDRNERRETGRKTEGQNEREETRMREESQE
jgi:hypothetical protein